MGMSLIFTLRRRKASLNDLKIAGTLEFYKLARRLLYQGKRKNDALSGA
jgi:hypothetical protein